MLKTKKGAKLTGAMGYIRCAGSPCGEDLKMQFDSISKYAKNNRYKVIDYFLDINLSGKDFGDQDYGSTSMDNILKSVKTGKWKTLIISDLTRIAKFPGSKSIQSRLEEVGVTVVPVKK